MSSHVDPQLAEKILHEVKSQGVFDEFRKDSISDVDTKPAYQNLRQRVEDAVQKFLSEQKWTPETNKYQLRERLRKHIVESRFFDIGVERIVDQVVNPKIATVFQPRIEEIAYKYLGISPPLPSSMREPPPLPPMPPLPPLPPMNGSPLQVDTKPPLDLLPTDLEQVSPDSDKMKDENSDDGMAVEEKPDDDDESPPFEPLTECKSPKSEPTVKTDESPKKLNGITESKQQLIKSTKKEDNSEIKEKRVCNDALAGHDSQLSQVSSDSRISSISNQLLQSGNDATSGMEKTNVNISEEAQMPKFNENSTESSAKSTSELHFDIKKDEIKFVGTERKVNILDGDPPDYGKHAPVIKDEFISESLEMKGSFHFTKLNVEVEPRSTTRGDASSVSSQDDTSSAQLCIVERPEAEYQCETNSVQKFSQEDSSTNTTINNSLKNRSNNKIERNGKQYSSSSSSSSRHKKSSTKDKKRHSSEKKRLSDERHHEKNKHRDRDHSKYTSKTSSRSSSKHHESSQRHKSSSKSKHSSKLNSSSFSRHHKSSDKHKSSSRRSEKEQHASSSSRSESRSHHKSSKRDHRDKYEIKKRHKSSSSNKERRNEDRKSRTDDHNESKEKKIRWRKSTDSNDEDKNPSTYPTSNNNASQQGKINDSGLTKSVSSKSNIDKSNKCDNENKKNASHESEHMDNTKDINENCKVPCSRVVFLNDVLEHPSTNFIELETKSTVQIHKNIQLSPTTSGDTYDNDLLYFEPVNGLFQSRLDLISEAINRCHSFINSEAIKVETCMESDGNSKNFHDKFVKQEGVNDLIDETNPKDKERLTETKATLLVDCYHYTNCNNGDDIENIEAITPKRLKLSTDCNIAELDTMSTVANSSTKENQMNEKNSIAYDEENKKATLSKRIDSLNKLSQQQRYSSEDLYKPRPVLGQRSKRRGLDSVI